MATQKSTKKTPAKKALVKRYLYVNPVEALYALGSIANTVNLPNDIKQKAEKKIGEIIDRL